MLAVSERKTIMRGSGALLAITGDPRGFPFPFPQSLQKSGNSNREVHQLSRFHDHQTACSCLNPSSYLTVAQCERSKLFEKPELIRGNAYRTVACMKRPGPAIALQYRD